MKYLLTLTLCSTLLFCNDTEILSTTKQQIIKLKKRQILEKEQINKYEWLSDVAANVGVSQDEEDIQTQDYSVLLSQDIYKFGGITSQIEYAKELKKMQNIDLDISTKEDISNLYSLLIDIKLNNINLKQNALNILNSEIDIRTKKSQYSAGDLGISDLNEAIMTRNQLQDERKEIELSKLTNINSVKKYTNKNYKNIPLSAPKLMSKEIFLQNATSLKYANLDITVNRKLHEINKSEYLPSVSVDAKYGYNETSKINGEDYYNYGLNISMPFSFTASNSIEQTKVEYLLSKQELNDEINSAVLSHDEVTLTIQNYKDRINLAIEYIELYDELLLTNKQEYEAGYKTLDDVETLSNSKQIHELYIKGYKLNIQKQIISLYYLM